jgi:acyl-CoA dehydrogenase
LYNAGDLNKTLANATTHSKRRNIVMAWIWLEQRSLLQKTCAVQGDFYQGKFQACRFYIYELPKVGATLTRQLS